MKNIILTLVFSLFILPSHAQCFTIVAGKKASKNNCVLLAHNEDDKTDNSTKSSYVPPRDGNLGYLWIEIAGLEVADSFLNDCGVCIVSNRSKSKEENMEEGGILYELRHEVALKATSARDGVRLATELVNRHSYRHNGRTYVIADRNEAWVLSLVGKRHYMAMRVPDTSVFILPNNFVFGSFSPSDMVSVITSPGMVEYALKRGWYDVAEGREFSFKHAFGDERTYFKSRNVLRHKKALEVLTSCPQSSDPDDYELFPHPKKKVTVDDLASLLRLKPICVATTRYSVVFELRKSPVTWLCHTKPDEGEFIRISR